MRSLLFFCISFIIFPVFAQDKLVFAVDLIRHGDRTPLLTFPTAPYEGTLAPGQLTPKGMQQAYELGLKFHKKYIEETKLLAPYYQSEMIYVRSTDYDRTIMTAQSVLLGLYPLGSGLYLETEKPALPEGFQPIPIHTREQKTDEIVPCELFSDKKEAFIQKHLAHNQEWQKRTKELELKKIQWIKATKIPINHLYQMIKISDALRIYQENNVKLPAGLTPNDIKEIQAMGHWAFTTTTQTPAIGYTLGHKMLNIIVQYLVQLNTGSGDLKYVLFSGHDSSILSLMSAMQAPLDELPGYLANVNFSVYEKLPKDYYVIITYNDKPVNVPACGGMRCQLRQLEQLAELAKQKADPMMAGECRI